MYSRIYSAFPCYIRVDTTPHCKTAAKSLRASVTAYFQICDRTFQYTSGNNFNYITTILESNTRKDYFAIATGNASKTERKSLYATRPWTALILKR